MVIAKGGKKRFSRKRTAVRSTLMINSNQFLFLTLLAIVFYVVRRRWYSRHYTPLNSFQRDVEDGLTSNLFNTQDNIDGGDSRPGLDGSADIKAIMEEMECSFDDARLIRQQRLMQANGIDPLTGMPLDPKAIYFKST
jgi:hypothetical protein